MYVHGVTKVIRNDNNGEALDFLIKRAGVGMENVFSEGQTGSSRSWFGIECKEGERLVRETLACFWHKDDDSNTTSYWGKQILESEKAEWQKAEEERLEGLNILV